MLPSPRLIGILFITLLIAPIVPIASGSEADDLREKGIAALKDSQANPRVIVEAARLFVKAAGLYGAAGNEEKNVEMNSFLYWCKKKMTMEDIDAFTKGGETTVAVKLAAVEKAAPKVDEAQKWFDRADLFAKKNPNEHLLIAIRFYEIADRFKGSDTALQAMDRSLKEQLLDKTPTAKAVLQPGNTKPPAPSLAETGKQAVPAADALKQAEKLIKDLFKAEYAKTDAPSRLELVPKLLQQADENKADPAALYVLLHEARDVAAMAGDGDKASEALKRLREAFKFDRAAMLLDLRKLESTSKTPEAAAALATVLASGGDEALTSGDYDHAVRYYSRADDLQPLIKEPTLKAHLKSEYARAQAMRKEWLATVAAEKTLTTKPDDPDANFVAGRFALMLGDFEKCMPLLEKGKDVVLKGLAKGELAQPKEASEQIKLADGWFERSEKEPLTYLKTRMQERAALWYTMVLPGLTGLVKLRIEERLKILPQVAAPTPPKAPEEVIPPIYRELTESLNKLDNWKIENGTWTQDADGILGAGDSSILFNSKLPPSFTLEFKMNVKEGMRPRVRFSDMFFGNEGYEKNMFIHGIKSNNAKNFPYKNNQVFTVKVVFDKDRFEFFVNGDGVGDGKRKSSAQSTFKLSGGDTWSRGKVLYSDFKIYPVGDASSASAKSSPVSPASSKPTAKTSSNWLPLLGLINLDKDIQAGNWEMRDGVLIFSESHAGGVMRVRLPYEPPEEYDLKVVFERTSDEFNNASVMLILSKWQKQFNFYMGDNAGFQHLRTRQQFAQGFRLLKDVRYTVVVQVRKNGATAFINDQKSGVIETDYSELKPATAEEVRNGDLLEDAKSLGLAAYRCKVRIFSADVLEVTGRGKQLREQFVLTPVRPADAADITIPPVDPKSTVNVALSKSGATITGDGKYTDAIIDGNIRTLAEASFPCEYVIKLAKAYPVSHVRMRLLDFEADRYYQYKIETSPDGEKYTMLSDQSKGKRRSWQIIDCPSRMVKTIRITGLRNSSGPGFQIVEFEAYGVSPGDPPVVRFENE